MFTHPEQRPSAGWAVAEAAAVGTGLALFALFVHSRWPAVILSFAGLALAAGLLAVAVARAPSPAALFGFTPLHRSTAAWAPLGATVGIGMALAYRRYCDWSLLPEGFAGFALVAAMIGAAEEVVYRGYVQGRLRGLGVVGAVIGAAVLHTAYKGALFAFPPAGAATDVQFVATWTLVGGILFGTLRELSGNVFPPLAAHVVFDLWVYAEQTAAPWWVWS
jgi:membrane protease YdiL (CAAX protease family)